MFTLNRLLRFQLLCSTLLSELAEHMLWKVEMIEKSVVYLLWQLIH